MHIQSLTTDRLRLVPLSLEHSEGMFRLWSAPEVCQYSGDVSNREGILLPMPAADPSISDQIIEFWLHAVADGWGLRWAITEKDTQKFFGIVGFNSLSEASEIAYHLLPIVWGRGLMSQAVTAAMAWRRNRGGCTAFDAFIDPQNTKSVALAKRLGFGATETFSEGAQLYRLDSRNAPTKHLKPAR